MRVKHREVGANDARVIGQLQNGKVWKVRKRSLKRFVIFRGNMKALQIQTREFGELLNGAAQRVNEMARCLVLQAWKLEMLEVEEGL